MVYLWPGCAERAETSWQPDFLQHVWVGQAQAEHPLVEGVGSKVLREQWLGSAVFFFLPCLLWQGCSTSPFSGPKTSINPSLCLAALPATLCAKRPTGTGTKGFSLLPPWLKCPKESASRKLLFWFLFGWGWLILICVSGNSMPSTFSSQFSFTEVNFPYILAVTLFPPTLILIL